MLEKDFLVPRRLQKGDTIGIFTPSSPAYRFNPELFENGVRNIEGMGFKVKLGKLTAARASEGYRSASGLERANEFMELVNDPEVRGLIATIGGYNSSSMLPFLDYEQIRNARKVICGYSDVTSLHMAIYQKSKLQTFYGPAVMTWLGEWPNGIPESTQWFLDAIMEGVNTPREIGVPTRWSCHRRAWNNGDWKNVERQWIENEGWCVLNPGTVTAPILALNLNTMLCLAGTEFWPNFQGRILLIEEMDAPMARTERCLRQLSLMGVFNEISGLIVSKPEVFDAFEAPFGRDSLLCEIIGKPNYPVVTNFDCGHTVPMITVPQGAMVNLNAQATGCAIFRFV